MVLTPEQLRDVIICAHELASGAYRQSDTLLRQRIAKRLGAAIMADDIMRGFLGFGGPCADRDIIKGSGSLRP